MTEPVHDVAVVGGGIVGAACAFALRKAGVSVVLIDRGDLRAAASWGNAGHFAYDDIFPLATPGLWLQLPRLLLSPQSPVHIPLSSLRLTTPWLARFLFNTRPSQVRHATSALTALLEPSRAAWRRLSEAASVTDLIRTGPALIVARSRKALESRRALVDTMRRRGIAVSELDAAAARAIEPTLRSTIFGAFSYSTAQYCVDPGALTRRLVEALVAAGGSMVRDDVRRIVPNSSESVTIEGAGRRYVARRCVLATGIRSGKLLKDIGVRVPLAAERGYHLMVPYRAGSPLPRIPLIGARPEFVMTPMADGLRLAGTVELAPADAPPTWDRATMLRSLAEDLVGPLELPEDPARWMGSRPTLPDSLPAIGSVQSAPSIIAAFGHQHLGLTLAAITADMVRAIALRQPAPVPLQPFAPERFSR
jgi:glycine/D-amino acid oxidase-like deaminating enzyme